MNYELCGFVYLYVFLVMNMCAFSVLNVFSFFLFIDVCMYLILHIYVYDFITYGCMNTMYCMMNEMA